jgi:hypothetical protein
MSLDEASTPINTKADFENFVEDLKTNKTKWENDNLERFLEAMSAWLADKDDLPEKPDWETFRQLLLAAKIYE